MIELNLQDNEYQASKEIKDRVIGRAVVIEDDHILILQVDRDDLFGKARYLETPGGGIDMGEEIAVGLKRELDEELGVKAEIITKLGVVSDYYNLLNRHNINHYYLVKVTGYTHIHHESAGDSLIEGILKMNIEDILKEYQGERETKIKRLVYAREEPIFKEAYRYLKEHK